MKLRVFLPALERPDADTRFAWILFDAHRNVLREEATNAANAPRADEVEAVLPASRVLFARLKLPRVNAATIRELLPYAVEDRLVADPSHVHAVAGRRRHGSGETTVAVVDREWLAAMLDALRHASIRPTRAWCESALAAGGDRDWNVVWGPQRGMLVDDEGVSVAFDRGTASDTPLAIRIALDEAAALGRRPLQIRVHSEGGEPPPDLEQWSMDGAAKFAAGTTWERLRAGEPSSQAINLLQGEFASRPSRFSVSGIPRAAVALAALILILQLAFVAVDAWRLERERASLEAKREAVFRDAFPEAKTIVDPQLQMARNLAELKRARGMASEDDFLAQVTRAARESRAPARSIEYADGRLQVRRDPAPKVAGRAP